MTIFKIKHVLLSATVSLALAVVTFGQDPNKPIDANIGSSIPVGASNDQQPGSVLVYNYYKSGAMPNPGDNTRVNMTNLSTTQAAFVHIFLIADTCQVADSFICLTANQTISFLVSDIDPGVTGYMIAVAIDGVIGVPTGFNFLIGSEQVKLASGHQAKLNAESFQALFRGPLHTSSPDFAVISFDGVKYTKAPRVLAVDNIPSVADGNSTFLVVNSINGNLAAGLRPIGSLFGILYDDAESAFSFTTTGGCQLSGILSDEFPRTTPRFTTVITAGRSGYIKLSAIQDRAITGASINFNSSSSAVSNGGSNLHHLNNTSGIATLTIPAFPPSC